MGTVFVVVYGVFTRGVRGVKNEYLAQSKTDAEGKRRSETVDEKKRRRVMAYAIPVCVATWAVLAWKLPTLDRPQAEAAPAAPAAQTRRRCNAATPDHNRTLRSGAVSSAWSWCSRSRSC